MQLERLKLFAESVKAGSFTQAANTLGVSKAYLSKHIKELETELATQLLIRNTRNMRLTASGEALLQHANKLLHFWADSKKLVNTADQSLTGDVSFTAPTGLMEYCIMPALQPVLEEYPDIHLKVHTGNQTYNLVDTHYDFAIRITNAPPLDMVAHKLFDYDYVVCCSPGYAKRFGTPDSLADLDAHDCISLAYWQEWSFTSSQGTTVVDSKAKHQFVDNSLIKLAAIKGLGIARLPAYMVRESIQSASLVELFKDYHADTRSVYLLYPQTIKKPVRVQKVIDAIKAAAAYF